MSLSRFALTLAATGISILLCMTTPALAGHGHGGGHAFAFGKVEKHGGGHHFRASGNRHGNKHGQLRGLGRADEVAGSHGKQGRTNAAEHQSGDGASYGDSDGR